MTKLTMKIWREEDDKADYVAVPERPEGPGGQNHHRGLLCCVG